MFLSIKSLEKKRKNQVVALSNKANKTVTLISLMFKRLPIRRSTDQPKKKRKAAMLGLSLKQTFIRRSLKDL